MTSPPPADGEAVWSWRPDAGVKFAGSKTSRGRGWQESPVARESAQESVNTIARGMPGDFRCDLTNACVAIYRTHCTRGYRAHRAPGIPAPSEQRAELTGQTSGETSREIAKACVHARSCLNIRSSCGIGVIGTVQAVTGPHPEELAKQASRRMATAGLSWFETREDALLTMRISQYRRPVRSISWLAMTKATQS